MPEEVYCVPAACLPAPSAAVLPLTPELYGLLLSHGSFRLRERVEEDPHYRQIIPYAVIEQQGKVLRVERLKGGSEARLHNLFSIGLGGHINPGDHSSARDLIEGALVRELREELELGGFFAEGVGLIHRSETPVERVHTGVLYRVRVAGEVTVREREKLEGSFITWDEVRASVGRLEGWSQAALHFLAAAAPLR